MLDEGSFDGGKSVGRKRDVVYLLESGLVETESVRERKEVGREGVEVAAAAAAG